MRRVELHVTQHEERVVPRSINVATVVVIDVVNEVIATVIDLNDGINDGIDEGSDDVIDGHPAASSAPVGPTDGLTGLPFPRRRETRASEGGYRDMGRPEIVAPTGSWRSRFLVPGPRMADGERYDGPGSRGEPHRLAA